MSDSLDLDAIEARARAATPGPWTIGWTGISESWVAFTDGLGERGPERRTITTVHEGNPSGCEDDAAHIAGMDPATTLALVARLREAETRLAKVRDLHRQDFATSGDEAYGNNARCAEDGQAWPCATALAFQGSR